MTEDPIAADARAAVPDYGTIASAVLALHEPQLICGVCHEAVFIDEDGDAWHRVDYEEMFEP